MKAGNAYTILGTPPVPSPLTPRPLAQFPVPCLPRREPLPLFLAQTSRVEIGGLDSEPTASTSALYNNLPHPKHARPNSTLHAHTQTHRQRQRSSLRHASWPDPSSDLLRGRRFVAFSSIYAVFLQTERRPTGKVHLG